MRPARLTPRKIANPFAVFLRHTRESIAGDAPNLESAITAVRIVVASEE